MKSLISAGVLAASLALSANAAMAAGQPVHTAATTAHVIRAVWPDVRRARAYHGPYRGAWPYAGYAASGAVPQSQFGFDAGQFIQGLLGGGANLAHDARSLPASRGYSSPAPESPSYDYSASTSDAQNQANEQANQMQQMNDENALINSMQAAEQQNEAANAATIQTEINAAN
jgi:hypothetical protein